MNKYQFSLKTESGLGKVYYYCYAEDRFETYLNIKNIKYKKNWKNQGRNLFDELQQELQRKDNIINELKKWLNEPQITYNLDATEFGVEKIECVSVKDTLNKIKELESK